MRPGLAYCVVRRERAVALLGEAHPLAGKTGVALADLAEDQFLLFPRDLGPRLYDFLVALCRRAGFEPRHGRESFHSRWTIGSWDATTVGLVPGSVGQALPAGVKLDPLLMDRVALKRHRVFVVWHGRGNDQPVAHRVAANAVACSNSCR